MIYSMKQTEENDRSQNITKLIHRWKHKKSHNVWRCKSCGNL